MRTPSLLAVAALLALLACGGASEAPPAAPPATPSPSPAAEHGGAEHGGADHGHGAAHGGIQKELDGMHVEGLAMPDGVMFWPTDGDARPLPLEGFSGNATIKGPAGVEQVPLMAMGDHLHAPAKLVQGQPATIVVTLTRDGKAQSATFEVPKVGLESHDHTSLHGGEVGMWANYHVEYVGTGSEHRFWITDATRLTLKDGFTATVKDGETTLPLTLDPQTGALSAKAEGAGSRPVSIEVKAGETTFSLPFQAKAAGAAGAPGQGEHGGGGHAH